MVQTSIIGVVALSLCVSAPIAAQAAASSRAPALEIAAEDEAAPWSRRDGTGYANDIVRAAFKAVGIEVSFLVVPYARCKQMVTDGTVVACFSMSRVGVDSAVMFPASPLFTCDADYYVRTDRPRTAGDRLLTGTVVGVVRGYEYPASVSALRERGVITLEESPSEVINLKKLADGRIGAALINHNATKRVAGLIAESGTTGKVRPIVRAGTLASFIGFSQRHPDGRRAMARFATGIQAIKRSGELGRIERRWGGAAP